MSTTPKTEAKPLSDFSQGSRVTVSAITGGKGARKKLYDLGIVPGVTVEIAQGTVNHPYILQVGGTRIMIGWGMVQQIYVLNETS